MPDRYADIDDWPTVPPPQHFECTAEARAMAIVDCGLCDDEGYRGSSVCDHIEHGEAARRGMAMIRESMGWNQPTSEEA